MKIKVFFELIRLPQWIKNTFVFAPLIFAKKFLEFDAVQQEFLAFFAFCIASSASYILNDLKDLESDRRHSVKRLTRPLASGAITPMEAKIILIFFYFILSIFFLFSSTQPFMIPILGYLILNILYTYKLKHIPVLDIFCIAAGFVLRVFSGGIAICVPISSWMLITTLCLALFLASIKRLQEFRTQGKRTRKALEGYTLKLLEIYAQISSIGALIFYSLFVITSQPNLILSIPFVIFGFFRYWYIIEIEGKGESPTEILLKDIPLDITIVLWILFCLWKLWPA